MKRILVTGANSYIGTSFENYIKENFPDQYTVDTVDMIDGSWREKDFSGYDTIFHVAAIVHVKETDNNSELYYTVNRDLSFEVAKKAKENGVKQFIYLSSVSVYGLETGVIKTDTVVNPKSNYGKSKLQAEKMIISLESSEFSVAVVRPPMVYGKGCKGNFTKIVSIVNRFPIFPKIKNERSMIYIYNLSSFIQFLIQNNLHGIFLPQNKELMCTSMMSKWIAEKQEKKVFQSRLLGLLVICLRPFCSTIKKAFGNLVIDIQYDIDYHIVSSEDSVKESV